jgi:hypothetical protein
MSGVQPAPPTYARGGFGYEAAPSRSSTDSHYVADGVGDPYTGGRAATDGIFKYYSRHPLPRATAPTGMSPGAMLKKAERPLLTVPSSEPASSSCVGMSCNKCQGSECMFQVAESDPFCTNCNKAALKSY